MWISGRIFFLEKFNIILFLKIKNVLNKYLINSRMPVNNNCNNRDEQIHLDFIFALTIAAADGVLVDLHQYWSNTDADGVLVDLHQDWSNT